MQKIHEIREAVRRRRPLIHCITNPISIHLCANAILAVGARPIMAEHPGEVREITRTADALLVNLGNITDVRMKSMLLSAEEAKEKGIPLVLDAVGLACSTLRRNYALRLTELALPSLIKGNYSEISALCKEDYRSVGVDAEEGLTEETVSEMAVKAAKDYGTMILASGKTDILTDGNRLILLRNGCRELSSITGTGCMLGALSAAYLTAGHLDAAAAACAVLGISGQLALSDRGSGTFQVSLMDSLSCLGSDEIDQYIDLEERNIEKT